MQKSAIFLCLAFLLCATALANRLESSGRMRKLSFSSRWSRFWSKTRTIQLKYDTQSGNYAMSARFINSRNNSNIDSRWMLPNLHSTDNWVVNTESSGFESYADYSFTQGQRAGFSTPYMTGSGFAGNAPITVACKDGSIMTVGPAQANNAVYGSGNVIRATTLNTKVNEDFGDNSYGMLGFGISNLAANGMEGIFSVFLDKYDRNNSVITFDNDLSYSRDIFSTASWVSNGSFITTGNLQIKIEKTEVASSSYNLMFDQNVNITGVPSDLFYALKDKFAQFGVTGCSDAMYQPVCNFNGKIKDLPIIYINNVGNSKESIPIPPKVYVAGTKQSNGVVTQVVLNFKLLGTEFSDPNGVSNANHKNDIILDASFMSYYLTVFENNNDGNGLISIYRASGSPHWYGRFYSCWPRWVKILTWFFSIMIVAVCLVACICSRKRAQPQAE